MAPVSRYAAPVDPERSEHAYAPTRALLVLPLLTLIALPIMLATRPPATPWGPLQYLIVTLLSALPALGMSA